MKNVLMKEDVVYYEKMFGTMNTEELRELRKVLQEVIEKRDKRVVNKRKQRINGYGCEIQNEFLNQKSSIIVSRTVNIGDRWTNNSKSNLVHHFRNNYKRYNISFTGRNAFNPGRYTGYVVLEETKKFVRIFLSKKSTFGTMTYTVISNGFIKNYRSIDKAVQAVIKIAG